ncbi:hypothetical protein B0H17DRAFT_1085485 [Mycena rosella]|uniref:Uncharacterized protein n=1 Tax=Mycena rosella TaxID=1033263 RepID=A0AAD7CZG1_MYCRO|nr:hypothetical protein B0H17DRAFT_1085485 [Mycena rosella]
MTYRDPLAADDPVRDLDAMHPRHSLRRSGRLRTRDATRPRPVDDVNGAATPPPRKWLDKRGRLLTPDGSWTLNTSEHATIRRDTPLDALTQTVACSTPATRTSHAKPSKGCKTKRGH